MQKHLRFTCQSTEKYVPNRNPVYNIATDHLYRRNLPEVRIDLEAKDLVRRLQVEPPMQPRRPHSKAERRAATTFSADSSRKAAIMTTELMEASTVPRADIMAQQVAISTREATRSHNRIISRGRQTFWRTSCTRRSHSESVLAIGRGLVMGWLGMDEDASEIPYILYMKDRVKSIGCSFTHFRFLRSEEHFQSCGAQQGRTVSLSSNNSLNRFIRSNK
jgi:hypothetical protein